MCLHGAIEDHLPMTLTTTVRSIHQSTPTPILTRRAYNITPNYCSTRTSPPYPLTLPTMPAEVPPFTLSIAVFPGTGPLDTYETRHTLLHLTSGAFKSSMNLRGAPGFFHFEEHLDYDAHADTTLAGLIEVGTFPAGVPYAAVLVAAKTVVLRHKDPEFTAHTWCAEVMERFVSLGWLERDEMVRGVERMVGVLVEEG